MKRIKYRCDDWDNSNIPYYLYNQIVDQLEEVSFMIDKDDEHNSRWGVRNYHELKTYLFPGAECSVTVQLLGVNSPFKSIELEVKTVKDELPKELSDIVKGLERNGFKEVFREVSKSTEILEKV